MVTFQESTERHVLVVNGQRGKQAIALEAAAYSIGRDLTNAIILDFETISRQHAILLRVPVPGTNRYRYRLVDGNADGKPSTNGTFINGKRCVSETLHHGDTILFGRKVKAAYLSVAMNENEFAHYLESIRFQSIKSQALSPKETLVGQEFSGELLAQQLNKITKEISPTPLAAVTKQSEPFPTSPERSTLPTSLPETPSLSAPTQVPDNPKETLPENSPDPIPRSRIQTLLYGTFAALVVLAGVGWWFALNNNSPGQDELPRRTPNPLQVN